jgi:hypothetical protein
VAGGASRRSQPSQSRGASARSIARMRSARSGWSGPVACSRHAGGQKRRPGATASFYPTAAGRVAAQLGSPGLALVPRRCHDSTSSQALDAPPLAVAVRLSHVVAGEPVDCPRSRCRPRASRSARAGSRGGVPTSLTDGPSATPAVAARCRRAARGRPRGYQHAAVLPSRTRLATVRGSPGCGDRPDHGGGSGRARNSESSAGSGGLGMVGWYPEAGRGASPVHRQLGGRRARQVTVVAGAAATGDWHRTSYDSGGTPMLPLTRRTARQLALCATARLARRRGRRRRAPRRPSSSRRPRRRRPSSSAA